jgi:hypothetical protein
MNHLNVIQYVEYCAEIDKNTATYNFCNKYRSCLYGNSYKHSYGGSFVVTIVP